VLEGERKQVTVLFADLKGSMELLADRDPEEARQLLDPVLERMMAAMPCAAGHAKPLTGNGAEGCRHPWIGSGCAREFDGPWCN
jgi:class 3 adenylate cyclase